MASGVPVPPVMLPSHVVPQRGLSLRPGISKLLAMFTAFTMFTMFTLALASTSERADAQVGIPGKGQGAIPDSINPNAASGVVIPSSDNTLVSANATHTYDFTLTDTSSHSGTVTLSISGCTGAVSGCSVSSSSVFITAGISNGVTVTYTTGSMGTGVCIEFCSFA